MDELKKNLINIINYTINKKMNIYNSKLDYIIQKIDYNLELTLKMMENLKNNSNINDADFDKNIKCLKELNLELKKNIINEKEIIYNNEIVNEKEIIEIVENNEIIEIVENNEIIEIVENNEIIEIVENNEIINKDINENETKKEIIEIVENNEIMNKDINEKEIIKDNKIIKENESFNEKEIIKDNIKKKSLNKKNTDEIIKKYKDIKHEYFDIDDEFINNCLNNTNINGDIKLFKKMYIDKTSKEYYPLRHIKKKFQYWLNDHMVDDDSNGSYIKNTILKNISDCYLRVNTYENYSSNIEQFLNNQEHINKLMEEKYKDKFLNKLITIIDL